MADLFVKDVARKLMEKKRIYFIGDSNMRAMYKDYVQLLKKNSLIKNSDLKKKAEPSFNDDVLVYTTIINKSRNFKEERRYNDGSISAHYYFVTKCFNEYTDKILRDMRDAKPDVIIYNSCLWDICRWGPNGPTDFKKSMDELMTRFKKDLPKQCLVIFLTTPPVSSETKAGYLVTQLEFIKKILRFEIMEANLYTSYIVTRHGYDCLDVHYHLRWQMDRQQHDGVHWLPHAMRHVTNLILTHIALAWNFPLPKVVESQLLKEVMNMENEPALQRTHGDAKIQQIDEAPQQGKARPNRKLLKAKRKRTAAANTGASAAGRNVAGAPNHNRLQNFSASNGVRATPSCNNSFGNRPGPQSDWVMVDAPEAYGNRVNYGIPQEMPWNGNGFQSFHQTANERGGCHADHWVPVMDFTSNDMPYFGRPSVRHNIPSLMEMGPRMPNGNSQMNQFNENRRY